MKLRNPINRGEWLSAMLVLPALALVFNYLLFGNRLFAVNDIWLYSLPTTIVIGFFFWYLYILSIHWLRLKLPDIRQTTLRVLCLASLHIGLMITAFMVIFFIYDSLEYLGYSFQMQHYYLSLMVGGATALIGTPLREGFYVYEKWKESLVHKEVMQQLSIKQEFELLKQQVDPHFLFNCFNTLSSLITEDINRADHFLSELRKVYHYLLNNKQEDFVTVEKELHFIRSYYALLQTRFGDALELTINVSAKHYTFFIPSLSLQLLVENAVKHNIVSKSRKLYISIVSNDHNELVVTNNLQRKLIKGRSFGIGMETIKAKYGFIQQKGIEVKDDQHQYIVIMPLVSSGKKLGKEMVI